MSKLISGICVKSITAALPAETLGIDFFSSLYGEKEVARIVRGTGIRAVRSANGMTTSSLISAAARHLLSNTDVSKDEIDGLVVVTQTPDDWSPGCAFTVHYELKLDTSCLVMDVNAGCAGYVNGLVQAAALVSSGVCANVLLCTGDVNSRLIDDYDYQIRMLFGDAASATLITRGDDSLSFISGVDGGGKSFLGVQLSYAKSGNETGKIHSLKMDGAAVMNFALRRVPEAIDTLLNKIGISKESIDLFVLHQPNEFILNYIRNIIDISPEKFPIDVDGVGNTNSSSIPVLLSRKDWPDGIMYRNIVLCGFGVGLSWNALHLNLSNTKIFKPIEIL